MKRKIIYRRILLSILAAAVIFGIYFINKYPLYSAENENTAGKKNTKRYYIGKYDRKCTDLPMRISDWHIPTDKGGYDYRYGRGKGRKRIEL